MVKLVGVILSWHPAAAASSLSSAADEGAPADGEDRIGALPDDTLRDIVSRLPACDGARTSAGGGSPNADRPQCAGRPPASTRATAGPAAGRQRWGPFISGPGLRAGASASPLPPRRAQRPPVAAAKLSGGFGDGERRDWSERRRAYCSFRDAGPRV